jgi:transcriptional regulator with PAS, ATPase and Fis domain
MKQTRRGGGRAGGQALSHELLLASLEDLAGPALLLDETLAVVHATEAAEALVGTPIPLGIGVAKLLCGDAVKRPIAEALARGAPVTGTVERPGPSGSMRAIIVRAVPVVRGERRLGWVLRLDLEASEAGAGDAPIFFHGMWTRDRAMKQVFHVVERAASRDATALLRGETGTGKELVGRALHTLSPRRQGRFAAINCAALPSTLLESELFGHVRGAFTGAVRDHPGFFRIADGGTLFLDEVAEMPLELQAKLLRVLETKAVLPVGGREPQPVDVRVIAATHQSLRGAVAAGRFRAALMYRLRVIPVFLPSLRSRRGDVPLLAQKMVEVMNEEGGRQVAHIAPAALEALEAYPFPGNIRELRNALEYAYVIGEGPVLVPSDLPLEIVDPEAVPDTPDGAAVNAPPPVRIEEDPEVARIRRALDRAAGHRARAAQCLGISRASLWRDMRQHGVA